VSTFFTGEAHQVAIGAAVKVDLLIENKSLAWRRSCLARLMHPNRQRPFDDI
jgi:hypothetical protein